VQAGAIPPALEGKDVLATAQTGTGKTLSFIVPILEKLAKTESRSATALILLPTRELAMQVEVTSAISTPTPPTPSRWSCGGMAEGPQLQLIRRGARLIVATPDAWKTT
jgi:ATP-dependent RNA helicase RhlE